MRVKPPVAERTNSARARAAPLLPEDRDHGHDQRGGHDRRTAEVETSPERRRGGIAGAYFSRCPAAGRRHAVGEDTAIGDTGGTREVGSERTGYGDEAGHEDRSAAVAGHERFDPQPGGAGDTAAQAAGPEPISQES